MIKFILYNKNTNEIILALKDMPQNTDFENTRADIWFENKKIIGGINWDNVDWDYTASGINFDFEPNKYLYDSTINEITINPNWSQDEI